MKEFITFGKPVIDNDEISEVVDSLKSGWLGTGPKAKIFETEMAKYKGIDYSIALNSNRWATSFMLSFRFKTR